MIARKCAKYRAESLCARVEHILKKTFCTSSLCKDYRVGRELLLEIKVNIFTADVTR